jgi:hypothetical protein
MVHFRPAEQGGVGVPVRRSRFVNPVRSIGGCGPAVPGKIEPTPAGDNEKLAARSNEQAAQSNFSATDLSTPTEARKNWWEEVVARRSDVRGFLLAQHAPPGALDDIEQQYLRAYLDLKSDRAGPAHAR